MRHSVPTLLFFTPEAVFVAGIRRRQFTVSRWEARSPKNPFCSSAEIATVNACALPTQPRSKGRRSLVCKCLISSAARTRSRLVAQGSEGGPPIQTFVDVRLARRPWQQDLSLCENPAIAAIVTGGPAHAEKIRVLSWN